MSHLPTNLSVKVQDKSSGTVYGELAYLGNTIESPNDAPEVKLMFTFDPNFISRGMFHLAVFETVESLSGYIKHETLGYGNSIRVVFSLKLDRALIYPDGFTYTTAQKFAHKMRKSMRALSETMAYPAKFYYDHNSVGMGTLEVSAISKVPEDLLDMAFMNGYMEDGTPTFSGYCYTSQEQRFGSLRQWLKRSLITEEVMPTLKELTVDLAREIVEANAEAAGITMNDIHEGTYFLPCGCWAEDGCTCNG